MRSKMVLVAAFSAGLVTLSACGTTTVSGSATTPGAPAPAQGGGQQGGSAQITSVADLGNLVEGTASKKTSAHVKEDISMPGLSSTAVEADFKFAGAQSAMDMTMNIPQAGSLEMILVDQALYLKNPQGVPNPSGKPWVKIDLNGTGLSQVFGQTANLAAQSDPTQIIDKIKSSGTITKTTQENINGQATTHYAITVDVRKLAASLGPDNGETKVLDQFPVSTFPFDIWVGQDGLPAKVVVITPVIDPSTGKPMDVSGKPVASTVTATYTNWGKSVNITAPPPDQVGTLMGN